ncbi:MAG: acyl-CoA dehydrogenase family protein [Novosphingobium sp.]
MTDMGSFGAWELPEELRALKDITRRFMDEEVAPLENQLPHDTYKFPPELLKPLQDKARKLGLYAFRAPGKYGGAGLNLLAQAVVAEEGARCRMGSYTWGGGAFGDDPPDIIWCGNEDQIQRWGVPTVKGERKAWIAISEPSGGSDPARAIKTRAVRDGDDYVLNGSKTWITDAANRDWGIVFARTGDAADRRGITAFIVENGTPGLSFNEIKVIRSYSPYEVYFSDCRIPASQRLGEEGEGFKLADRFLADNRIAYSANTLGTAQAALELAIDWVKQRHAFGSALADKQAIQWMVADSEMEIRAARLLVYQAAWKGDLGQPFKLESSIAKVTATETAGRVVDRCIQMFGGLGVTQAMPLERWYRELRIKRIGEGPSEVHRMVVARELLGTRR